MRPILNVHFCHVLFFWLVFILILVDYVDCHGNQGFNQYATADSSAAKTLYDEQTTSKAFNRQHQRNSVSFETPSDPEVSGVSRSTIALVNHEQNLLTVKSALTRIKAHRASRAKETPSDPEVSGVLRSTIVLVNHEQNPPTDKSLPTRSASHHPKPKGSRHIHKTKKAKLDGKTDGKTQAEKMQETMTRYFTNNLKTSPHKRQRRESTNQQSCRFPSFLETSPLCLVSKLTPGKVCKWIHTQGYTPLFPFPNIVPPYHNWELQVSAAQMHNKNSRYLFDCIKRYSNNHYLVKITGKFEEIGVRYHDYTRFLCLKFVPRGLNVVQYMASKSSNVSEDLNCGTQKLKYVEQVLIADKFREVPDCPRDLRGAFKITRVHDAVHNATCHLGSLKTSLLESDCVNKEGIHLDFSALRGCDGFNNDTNGIMYTRDILYLRCYSVSWEKGGWSYVVVKRDKTTRKIGYRNTKMFHCLRFKKDPITSNIKLYMYFDSICGFDDNDMKNSTPYFVFDLTPLTSSLMQDAKKTELEHLRCDLPKDILGKWIEKSAYSGEQTIKFGKQNIQLGQDGEYMCMRSDRGKGIEQLFPTSSCVKRVWMERRKISHFNYSFILISANLPIGCRPRFVGFSVSQGDASSRSHLTYRLSQSIELPIDFIQDPMLFVQNSLPEKFCSDRHIFRLDPYPHWGRNIEKIAIRSNALTSIQPLMDCRLQGPLPNMFSGKLRINVNDGGMKNKCPGRIDICSSPTKIHLQYDAICRKNEVRYGCLGRVWDTKKERGQDHYLLQDLQTQQIYCARSSHSGFEIVRAASMQCYEFYWGLAAFQQQFHEKIDILAEGFMECPTGLPATDASGVVLEGDVSDLNITTVPLQNNTKIKAVSTSPKSVYEANIISLISAVSICFECLLL